MGGAVMSLEGEEFRLEHCSGITVSPLSLAHALPFMGLSDPHETSQRNDCEGRMAWTDTISFPTCNPGLSLPQDP